jgi:hypothetical protein
MGEEENNTTHERIGKKYGWPPRLGIGKGKAAKVDNIQKPDLRKGQEAAVPWRQRWRPISVLPCEWPHGLTSKEGGRPKWILCTSSP